MFKTELQNDDLRKIYQQNLKPNKSKPNLLKTANNVTSSGKCMTKTDVDGSHGIIQKVSEVPTISDRYLSV